MTKLILFLCLCKGFSNIISLHLILVLQSLLCSLWFVFGNTLFFLTQTFISLNALFYDCFGIWWICLYLCQMIKLPSFCNNFLLFFCCSMVLQWLNYNMRQTCLSTVVYSIQITVVAWWSYNEVSSMRCECSDVRCVNGGDVWWCEVFIYMWSSLRFPTQIQPNAGLRRGLCLG